MKGDIMKKKKKGIPATTSKKTDGGLSAGGDKNNSEGAKNNPRHVVFLHGVQWAGNDEVAGFSRKLQNEMSGPLEDYGIDVKFHEALWADVVESDQRRLIRTAEITGYLVSGNFVGAVALLSEEVHNQNVQIEGVDHSLLNYGLAQLGAKLFPSPSLPGLELLRNAASWLLDIVFYFTDHYGQLIRKEVRKTLRQAGAGTVHPPVVFAHSLGGVIIMDILREDLERGDPLSVRKLVTAGTPIGLFRSGTDDGALAPIRWVNFYDSGDFVAFWNPLRRFGYQKVTDREPIETGDYPIFTHTKYWGNGLIADELVYSV
jgi:hypothetical protein